MENANSTVDPPFADITGIERTVWRPTRLRGLIAKPAGRHVRPAAVSSVRPAAMAAGGVATGGVATLPATPAHADSHRHDQIAHDIRHELSTVMMLGAALTHTPDVGPDGRQLIDQLITEVRRADELIATLMAAPARQTPAPGARRERIELAELVESIAAPIRLASGMSIEVRSTAVTVYQDRLALWRAIRNLMCNAFEAAGRTGRIEVRVYSRPCLAVIQIDDDGPGMGEVRRDGRSLGLGIVEDLAASWGGSFETGTSVLGGCRVRLVIPLPPVGGIPG